MNFSSKVDAENVNFAIRLSKSIDLAHVHVKLKSRGVEKQKTNGKMNWN